MREDPEYTRIWNEFREECPGIRMVPLGFASWVIKRLALQQHELNRMQKEIDEHDERIGENRGQAILAMLS